jgi:hypothetical protein
VHFDVRRGKPADVEIGIAIGGDDPNSPRRERQRGCCAGAAEADDERAAREVDGACAQRRKNVKSR